MNIPNPKRKGAVKQFIIARIYDLADWLMDLADKIDGETLDEKLEQTMSQYEKFDRFSFVYRNPWDNIRNPSFFVDPLGTEGNDETKRD